MPTDGNFASSKEGDILLVKDSREVFVLMKATVPLEGQIILFVNSMVKEVGLFIFHKESSLLLSNGCKIDFQVLCNRAVKVSLCVENRPAPIGLFLTRYEKGG